LAANAPSIQFLILGESGAVQCAGFITPRDTPFTATAWIDVSGANPANCSDLSNPQCQPLPSDPQASQSGVMLYGQTTQIRLDVVDPP